METKDKILFGAAAVLFLAGLTWSIHSLSTTDRLLAQLHAKTADYQALQTLGNSLSNQFAALAAFEELEQTRPPVLRSVIEEAIPGVEPQVRQREEVPIASGWTLVRVDVTFDEVQLPVIGQLLSAGAERRPPWRMAECNIIASPSEPGHGRASLIMEALERTE